MKHLLLVLVIFFLSITAPTFTNALTLIPGGENIAFEIYPDGIIVTGSYDVNIERDTYNPQRDSDVIKGDRIIRIGDRKVTDLKSFTDEFYLYKDSGIIPLIIKRKDQEYQREIRLIKDGGSYKTGLYVKERLLGVGTVSFYDPINNTYGALAHEIYDNDSQSIIDVRVGVIYLESVESITPSRNGDVGNKNCDLNFEDDIGNIYANTKFGIFGNIEDIPSSYVPIEVANWDEVKIGKAILRTCIKGDRVEEFEICITSLKKQDTIATKGISFRITDSRLLSICGGIYQGMSGSPIIQNDKLVGAVTHVNVDDVESGYAVYMQYMYEKSLENLS